MLVWVQTYTNGARMAVRNTADLEVHSYKHPDMELMKFVYENGTVCRVLKIFPKYFHLLAKSCSCSQLKSLMLFSHITNST